MNKYRIVKPCHLLTGLMLVLMAALIWATPSTAQNLSGEAKHIKSAVTLAQKTERDLSGNSEKATRDKVIVTGEKVERDLMDTASSVSIFTADDIRARDDANSVSDIIKGTPNVIYTNTVGAPIIRGQDTQGPNFGSTAFFGGTIPRATINLDGHYLNFYEYVFGGTSIWDLETIEVFRGPQTTSQGANAIAGAIIVNTKDPTFTTEGAYQVGYGSYDSKRASFAVSGPVVKDVLAARVAADYWARDTFIDYTNPDFAKGDTDQDFETLTARAKLLWEPKGIPGLKTKLTYMHIYNNRPTYESASVPYDDLDNATGSMPSWEAKTDLGIFDINYDFANGMGLFNQIQYAEAHVDRVMEPKTNGAATIDQQNLSNDTRFTFGDIGATLNGVAGLYLARTTSNDILYIRGTSDFDDEKNNLGLYAETTYRFAERWALTFGLRFQQDNIQRSGTSPYAKIALDYDESFSALLPKASLAYDLTPDIVLGVLISRGYNPGGVNLSFATGKYITFEDETVWNYELFVRAQFLEKRLSVNGNLFFSDYKDSQRLLPDYLNGVQYGSYVVNADQAQSYGLELALNYLVLGNLRLKGGLGLLHTKIGEFSSAGGSVYEDNKFSRAPAYMFNLGVDWDIIPELNFSCDMRYTDGYYSTDENEPDYEVDGYTVANAQIRYKFRKYLQPYIFVNNIFDERTPAYLYDDRSVSGIAANMLEPRTFGIGIKGFF